MQKRKCSSRGAAPRPPGWSAFANGSTVTNYCNLYGVTCSGTSVVALNFASPLLTGTIPNTVGNLVNLTKLVRSGRAAPASPASRKPHDGGRPASGVLRWDH